MNLAFLQDVYSIINGKAGIKYAGVDVEALRAVAEAHKKRSLQDFQDVLVRFEPQLGHDPIIKKHIDGLYENLLEQNLIRIIEPFSTVQIAHVAKLIDLPVPKIESKSVLPTDNLCVLSFIVLCGCVCRLSEMILDKTLNGILDQGAGNLIVYDDIQVDVC